MEKTIKIKKLNPLWHNGEMEIYEEMKADVEMGSLMRDKMYATLNLLEALRKEWATTGTVKNLWYRPYKHETGTSLEEEEFGFIKWWFISREKEKK